MKSNRPNSLHSKSFLPFCSNPATKIPEYPIGGTDLSQLHDAVKQEFLTLDEREQSVRLVTARLETGFLRRFATFQHE